MSYATCEAAVQGFIQGLAAFADADVSLGDFRILNAGSPPYVVLVPSGFIHEEDGDGGQRITEWDLLVYLFERHYGDGTESTNLKTRRQAIMDELDKYPTLNGVANVTMALVTRGREPQPVFERGAGPEADPVLLSQILEMVVIEKSVATGGQYA
jgi:hypothetical protein